MDEHPHVETLRAAYAAFAAGDPDALPELFGEQVVWHVPGRSPVCGHFQGRAAIFAHLADLLERSGGTARMEVHDVLANDRHGVALVHTSATRGDRTHGAIHLHVFPFRDGGIAEFFTQPFDQYAEDEFWSA